MAKQGINLEQDYAYTSGSGDSGSCMRSEYKNADIEVEGSEGVPADEEQLAAYVATYGPISVSLDAMTQLWWPYASGVMTGCCNNDVDHAVLVVGFGTTPEGQDYWLIKVLPPPPPPSPETATTHPTVTRGGSVHIVPVTLAEFLG